MINHLAQPASFGLYGKAIVESGAYDVGAGTMAGAEASYQALLTGTSCKGLDCLKGKDASDLLAAGAKANAGPVSQRSVPA